MPGVLFIGHRLCIIYYSDLNKDCLPPPSTPFAILASFSRQKATLMLALAGVKRVSIWEGGRVVDKRRRNEHAIGHRSFAFNGLARLGRWRAVCLLVQRLCLLLGKLWHLCGSSTLSQNEDCGETDGWKDQQSNQHSEQEHLKNGLNRKAKHKQWNCSLNQWRAGNLQALS